MSRSSKLANRLVSINESIKYSIGDRVVDTDISSIKDMKPVIEDNISEATVDGKTVKIGDIVHFKSDVEQRGRILSISGDNLTLKSTSDRGFSGDYIGGSPTTIQSARDCWIE